MVEILDVVGSRVVVGSGVDVVASCFVVGIAAALLLLALALLLLALAL